MSNPANAKDSRIDLRFTQQQKDILERAANFKAISLSAYILFLILPTAQKEIDAQGRLVLSDRDRDLFMSVMANPPQLKGKLKSAIKKYRDKCSQN
jgi:uncharacterized protein (DUF1778 family)